MDSISDISKGIEEGEMNKYNATKTTIDGITFDSQREANRYCELKLLERAKEINGLQRQVSFTLIPPYTINGRKVRKMEYIADFTYFEKDGRFVVEDVKGFRTDVYKLKKKLFEYKYVLEIREV